MQDPTPDTIPYHGQQQLASGGMDELPNPLSQRAEASGGGGAGLRARRSRRACTECRQAKVGRQKQKGSLLLRMLSSYAAMPSIYLVHDVVGYVSPARLTEITNELIKTGTSKIQAVILLED
jgi:hypothetical protein